MAKTHWLGWVEPDLTPRDAVPLFPNTSFVPDSPCPHSRRLVPGSRFCCMVCHQSGLDALPVLQRDPRTDPRPEPKAPEPVAAKAPARPAKAKTSGKMARRRKARKLQTQVA